MRVEGIDHIVLAVKDIDEAARYFSRLFETSFEDFGVIEEIGAKSKLSPEGIELLSPVTQESAVAQFLKKRGEGVYAISFKVKDAEAAAADARRKGVRIVGEVSKDKLGSRVFNLREFILHPRDAYGVQVLLTESETLELRK